MFVMFATSENKAKVGYKMNTEMGKIFHPPCCPKIFPSYSWDFLFCQN